MVLGQIPHDRSAPQQIAQVTYGQNQIEVVGSVALLDQLEMTIKLGTFPAHQLDLRFGQAADSFVLLFDEVFFCRRRDDRFDIAGRVAVHRDHHLSSGNLPHWLHSAQLGKGI